MSTTRQEPTTGTSGETDETKKRSGSGRLSAPQTVLTVTCFTAAAGLLAVVIAFCGADPLTEAQKAIFDSLLSVFGLGSVVIIGLLGKAKLKSTRA